MSASSALVAFYAGTATDHRGRTLADIHAFPHARLEHEHDFIQWLFPLPTRSPVNPAAPPLDETVIAQFLASATLRRNLMKSFELMLAFYGFRLDADVDELRISKGPRWREASANWLSPGNHNFLRISRILRSLTLLGHAPAARAFLGALEDVYAEHAQVIGSVSIGHWRRAISSPR